MQYLNGASFTRDTAFTITRDTAFTQWIESIIHGFAPTILHKMYPRNIEKYYAIWQKMWSHEYLSFFKYIDGMRFEGDNKTKMVVEKPSFIQKAGSQHNKKKKRTIKKKTKNKK
jgi:hypothetical protein